MATDYFQAIRTDGEAAVQILGEVPNVNQTAEDGSNLLHAAVAHGNVPAAIALLGRGIDVNAQDAEGQSPLHYAAELQYAQLAEMLLVNGADVSLVDRHGNTPLWSAVFNARGTYLTVDVLLRHGGAANANSKNKHGRSPFDFAVQIGDAELMRRLENRKKP